jgi:FlaA1/EpsC-like NDP-sugar epimerase
MKSLVYYHRRSAVVMCHVCMIVLALAGAFFLRFDLVIPPSEIPHLQTALWVAMPTKMLMFLLTGQHRGCWRFVGILDLVQVLGGNLLASVGFVAAGLVLMGPSFPRSVYAIDFFLCFLLTGGIRFAVRVYKEVLVSALSHQPGKGILIYGAGAAGRILLREIQGNPSLGYQVVGFLDDDPQLKGRVLMGVPVLGSGRDASLVVDQRRLHSPRIDEVIIAMPSATGRQMGDALANCRAAGVSCKTIPGISELLSGSVLSAQIRNIKLEDLLGREQVKLEGSSIRASIAGRVILVTGAAGSIGSELCRQIASHEPERLVVVDQAESELFKIDLELRSKHSSLRVAAEIADIRDFQRIDEVILKHRVHSIFHAAAYKHVPLMEAHLLEAVKNNVIGTWNLVRAAHRHRVSSFLMISSDKAVNPTNIMGTTKRVAELIVSSLGSSSSGRGPRFDSVRFGNVLGSNGSVVPLFQEQIAAGGPVTVTHPDVRRYFMSVQEAVQLVLQASTMGTGSDVFVLDMGEPVRILDLAWTMIRLAGFAPHEDIEIRFTGLRPGEKLFEELNIEGENILPTYHEKIKIFRGPRIKREIMAAWILELENALALRNEHEVLQLLKKIVPEYQPQGACSTEKTVQAAVGKN